MDRVSAILWLVDVSTPLKRVLITEREAAWMELDERKKKILQAVIRNYL